MENERITRLLLQSQETLWFIQSLQLSQVCQGREETAADLPTRAGVL